MLTQRKMTRSFITFNRMDEHHLNILYSLLYNRNKIKLIRSGKLVSRGLVNIKIIFIFACSDPITRYAVLPFDNTLIS